MGYMESKALEVERDWDKRERKYPIAKLKVWFGGDIKDLINPKYHIEDNGSFIYVYEQ